MSDLFDVRLRTSDPQGFIAFVEVAIKTDIPDPPANQTAYLVSDEGNYFESQAGDPLQLRNSDERILAWIESGGVDFATCQALKSIIGQLAGDMLIVKTQGGADSTEFQSLSDIQGFYKGLLALCTEEKRKNAGNSSARFGQTIQPIIAGGNL